jgi:hypothetical protein
MRTPLVLLLVAAGCGGPLDPKIAGSWVGTGTALFSGLSPITYDAQMVIAVSGNSATVAGVCPFGGPGITATGSGDEAEWSGNISCSPMYVLECQNVLLTLKTASARLNADESLVGSVTGTSTGCGSTRATTLSFSGRK